VELTQADGDVQYETPHVNTFGVGGVNLQWGGEASRKGMDHWGAGSDWKHGATRITREKKAGVLGRKEIGANTRNQFRSVPQGQHIKLRKLVNQPKQNVLGESRLGHNHWGALSGGKRGGTKKLKAGGRQNDHP